MSSLHNISSKINIILLLVIISSLLFGCATFGKPKREREAKEEVAFSLGYEPKLIDKLVKKSDIKSNRREIYYEFEDKYGMRFIYSSRIYESGLDGATFYYYYGEESNYARCLIPFYEDTMRKLCDEYGMRFLRSAHNLEDKEYDKDMFGNDIQYESAGVIINGFDELQKVSKLVSQILDECRNHAKNEGILARDHSNPGIRISLIGKDGRMDMVYDFSLLHDDEKLSEEQIYDILLKEYVEKVKQKYLEDDLPEGLLDEVVPRYLKGRFNGEIYSHWTAVLEDDSEASNPVYTYTLKYREPMDRENYVYYENYGTKDLAVQNIIAQLGGTCFFHEAGAGEKLAGFQGYLGDDIYFFGFNGSMDELLIRKNDRDYIFKTTLYNPTGNEYTVTVSKEEFEELFGISIVYNYAESVFEVMRND